jgi:hypothetical protein
MEEEQFPHHEWFTSQKRKIASINFSTLFNFAMRWFEKYPVSQESVPLVAFG